MLNLKVPYLIDVMTSENKGTGTLQLNKDQLNDKLLLGVFPSYENHSLSYCEDENNLIWTN
jgi:hypothetical protein